MKTLIGMGILVVVSFLATCRWSPEFLRQPPPADSIPYFPSRIVVNQIGYYPNAQKRALFIGSQTPSPIAEIIEQSTKTVLLKCSLSTFVIDGQSGDTLRTIDFTALSHEGTYFLRVGNVQSFPFRVRRDVYTPAFDLMMRSYYLQRCGVVLNDSLTGVQHSACHLEDGFLFRADSLNPASRRIQATGGWHDAGDFGKYVVTTAITIGRLLTLYEVHPDLFHDHLHIPESGNRVPDVLDEVKIALDWLLTMQRSDGAIYRKLSGIVWTPPLVPQADTQKRSVFGISTPETAKFAAAMALAARTYKRTNPHYAGRCLQAALKAWSYLQYHPQMEVDWQTSDDAGSGKYLISEVDQEYELTIDTDDRFWAATELWLTTHKPEYDSFLSQTTDSLDYTIFEWKTPASLGMTNYVRWAAARGRDNITAKKLKQKILNRAERVLKRVLASGYYYGNDRIVWGSNRMAAEEGIVLMQAYNLTRKREYLNAALDQLDFLLGRNHFNLCFVSGVGANPVRHICHLFSRASGFYVPGFLSGGANEFEQANIAPKFRGLLSYVDDERSYSSNENAIDYNASMIALIGLVRAEMERER